MSIRSSSRASVSSSISNVLDEFNMKRASSSKRTDNLLYPTERDYVYRRLKNAVVHHGKLSKEDMAATQIQSTWRMHKIKKYFNTFIYQYRQVKHNKERPYFTALLLNSHVFTVDRRKAYENQFKKYIFCPINLEGHYRPTFENYTVTNQFILPENIDQDKLASFVKKVFHHRINKMFEEWRMTARRMRYDKQQIEPFHIDRMNRLRFGNYYVCFTLWFRYVRLHKKKSFSVSGNVPQFNHYMKLRQMKAARVLKADDQRITSIKHFTIQALLNLVIERREEEASLLASDVFKQKRNMRFALSAWAHYIVIQHNKINTERTIIRQWFGGIQRELHLKKLYEQFKSRHSIFEKRTAFAAFAKNKHLSRVITAHCYCKMQLKPSLALFFVHTLMGDEHEAAFTHAMAAWVALFRRRKMWHRFIFANINATEYDSTKRKTLAAFRNRTTYLQMPTSIVSKLFQQETMTLYRTVMQLNPDEKIFLFLSSKDGDEVQDRLKTATTKFKQRKIFFECWLKMEKDNSLISRLAIVNATKRSSQARDEKQSQAEKTRHLFHKSLKFLQQLRLASHAKFEALMRAIAENNRRALGNRRRCLHRDQMLVLAHAAHEDAGSYKDVQPKFSVNDKFLLFSRIQQTTIELTKAFQPLISVTFMGDILEQPNEYSFTQLIGLKTKIPEFKVPLDNLRKAYKSIISRAELGASHQIHFERLLAGLSSDGNVSRTIKSFLRIDQYLPPLNEIDKPKNPTGFNDHLMSLFPLKGRKPRVIGHDTEKFCMPSYNEFLEEEEAEDGMALSSTMSSMSSEINMESSKGSMFFKSLQSFSSIMSSESMRSFGIKLPTSGTELETFLEEVEAIPESGSSSYQNTERESEESSSVPSNTVSPQASDFISEGFDPDTMKSISLASPLHSPRTAKKYKLFMEILFGRLSRDSTSVPVNNLRRRLQNEFKNRKPAFAPHGVLTQDAALPVSNLLDMYRTDREDEEGEEVKTKDIRKSYSPLSTKSNKADGECSINYGSNKYGKLMSKDKASLFGSSSDDSDDLFEEKEHVIKLGEEEEEEVNEEVEEGDIDGTEQQRPSNTKGSRRRDHHYTPFTALDEDDEDDGAMKAIDKVVFSYLKKDLKDENGEGALVEANEEEEEEVEHVGPSGAIIKKKRLWQRPKFHPIYKPKVFSRKQTLNKLNKHKNPIVIESKTEITRSMEKVIEENRMASKLIFNNGKSTISQRKLPKVSKSVMNHVTSPYLTGARPNNDPYAIGGRSLFKSTISSTTTSAGFDYEDQVVSFGGGGRGIQEGPINFQRIKIQKARERLPENRKKPIVHVQEAPPIPKKAFESDDICSDYSNLRSIVGQLIQMLASAQDDGAEFERLRKRVRMLRKRPTFVGLFEPPIKSKDQFYGQLQSIYVRYTRRKDTRDAADSLLQLMQNNMEYAGVILKTIDRTAEEEREFMNTKLHQTKLSKKVDPGMAVHFVNLDWMTDVPNYSAVAVKYKKGHDKPTDLDALIAPTDKDERAARGRRERRRGFTPIDIPPPPTWDDTLADFTLDELIEITQLVVPEDLVDEVINDTYRTAKRII